MHLDFQNPYTERTRSVVNASKLRRGAARKKAQRFLAEGENAVDAAIATGAATDVFITEQAAEKFYDLVIAAGHMNIYVHPISESAANSLADTVTSPGIFAVCTPVLWSLDQGLGRKPRLVGVPVETSEPGNAGTLIRVADAVGADAVVFAGHTVDPQSPKVVRASAGSLFHVPVVRESNIEMVLSKLRTRGLNILATAADGEINLDHADELLTQPTAWLFGNEAHGLGESLLAKADYRVRIPIRGRAESLNVATAASICMYESAKAQYSQEDARRL
ncbi:TrmH family RNA methyltransferase [Corynebacterium freiburgense]|uniref:TrmH family RNA methyltransferase n=1 Tax=Corynebacterium freiburgense TaxID=556548 RepID=UPI0004176BB9|nr:RNA methyltransferase [Corynebacterium freiburgense]WJZ02522.1 23S rRNA (uridine(2479)-2'-O)-methyltransferase [Corynebacterium freiburgense]